AAITAPARSALPGDIEGASAAFKEQFALDVDIQGWLDADEGLEEEGIRDQLVETLASSHAEKTELVGAENMQRFEKFVLLRTLDDHWREHLAAMDHLRQSVGLRGYAQKNPKQEYKRESFELFSSLLDAFQREAISTISRVVVRDPAEVEAAERAQRIAAAQQAMQYQHAEASSALADGEENPTAAADAEGAPTSPAPARAQARGRAAQQPATPYVRNTPKLGRNDPCWCGSGKKFKQCHGKLN
ncbi:MAG: SEC-C metal-binding domain-containing protein, partial [Pseudomonadota bacterium]